MNFEDVKLFGFGNSYFPMSYMPEFSVESGFRFTMLLMSELISAASTF